MPFGATWMQLEIIMLSEVSQKEKDKYHDITYMWNLKYGTNDPVYETDSQTQRSDLWLPRGGGSGLGVSGWQMQTITFKTNKQQGRNLQHKELQ